MFGAGGAAGTLEALRTAAGASVALFQRQARGHRPPELQTLVPADPAPHFWDAPELFTFTK